VDCESVHVRKFFMKRLAGVLSKFRLNSELENSVDHGVRVTNGRGSGWPLHREGRDLARSWKVPGPMSVGRLVVGRGEVRKTPRLPPHREHRLVIWAPDHSSSW
jgi:hypothetical protein